MGPANSLDSRQGPEVGVVGVATVVTPLNFHCSVLEADYSMASQDWDLSLYFACENDKKPSRHHQYMSDSVKCSFELLYPGSVC